MKKVLLRPKEEIIAALVSRSDIKVDEPYIEDFCKSLPKDRVVEIDECGLWLSDGGNYYDIVEIMIEKEVA